MKPAKNKTIIMCLILLVLVVLPVLLSGCGRQEDTREYYTSLSQLEHKRIGVETGKIQADQAKVYLPDAEYYYFNSSVDMLTALRAGKIDAYADTEALVKYIMPENPDLTYLEERISDIMQISAIFPKTDSGRQLCDEYSEFIREIKGNGVYDEIQNTWFGSDEEKKVIPDLHSVTGSRGTLRVAADTKLMPFIFIKDGELAGIDVDILVRFCKEYDYSFEIVQMDFGGILPAVSTGKCDMASGGFAYTEERAESVYFAEPSFEGGSVIAVLTAPDDDGQSVSDGFFTSLKNSFVKTFIREDRWKMLLSGLLVTLALSALSGLFGTVLGGVICFLRMRKNVVARKIAGLYLRVFRGIPIVVLLLVLNYLIFIGVDFPAFWVCVIGFALDFSAYTSEMFRNGIEAVPAGQFRAAAALGFGKIHGFYKVVLPQALIHIVPVYTGQFVTLVKLTSVAGYISVMDLTRASDIIRSYTYEAFFPLILTSVIYFLLSVILIALLRKLETRIRPGSRRIKKVRKLMEQSSAGTYVFPQHERPASSDAQDAGEVIYRVSHLQKKYENAEPLKDLNCEICSGDVIAVIGPSGTGKSTFLNQLNQLESADGGEILFHDESILTRGYDLKALRRKVGMVFQSFFLFSHLTIVENVMLAQKALLHRTKGEAFQYSMEMLARVGLSEKALNYPAELSGGQQQRVAIAREVAMDPEMILFDEPTSALDPTAIGEVLSVIRNLAKNGMTMVIVTHEMKFARDVSNRVFYLDEGTIYEEGTPEQIFQNPQKEKTRQFVRHCQVLELTVNGLACDYAGAVTKIDTFGHRHMITPSVVRKMTVITEELGVQILLNHFREKTNVWFVFEYQEETGQVYWKAVFEGQDYDPLREGDKISVTLIRNASDNVSYSYVDGKGVVEGNIIQV